MSITSMSNSLKTPINRNGKRTYGDLVIFQQTLEIQNHKQSENKRVDTQIYHEKRGEEDNRLKIFLIYTRKRNFRI